MHHDDDDDDVGAYLRLLQTVCGYHINAHTDIQAESSADYQLPVKMPARPPIAGSPATMGIVLETSGPESILSAQDSSRCSSQGLRLPKGYERSITAQLGLTLAGMPDQPS